MPDLAPDIVRQRILIEGYYTVPIPIMFAPSGEGPSRE